MINKILNKLKGSYQLHKTPISKVTSRIDEIRSKSEILAICANNTGNNWLGIKRGTQSLFPESTLVIDQYYSNPVYSREELKELAEAISKANFSKIFFRGFPEYFENIINDLNQHGFKHIWILFAGPFSELNIEKKRDSFSSLIQLTQEKKIEGLGFNKIGLAEAVGKLYGIRSERYINKAPIVSNLNITPLHGVHIGVFSGNTFNKNKHTQVLSGLLVNDAKVHVFNKNEFKYLKNNDRIIEEKSSLGHNQFMEKLGEMTLNSYLSFSESWGNVILESTAVGIPCLTTANNGVFFLNSELEKKLVVRDYDDIIAITKQMQKVIEEKEILRNELLNYGRLLNEYADNLFSKKFL